MKYDSQIQTRHTRREQCFLHVSIISLNSSDIFLEFISHSLPFELTSQFMERFLDFHTYEIIRLSHQLPDTFFINPTFCLKDDECTKNDTAQPITGLIFHETFSISFLNQLCRQFKR